MSPLNSPRLCASSQVEIPAQVRPSIPYCRILHFRLKMCMHISASSGVYFDRRCHIQMGGKVTATTSNWTTSSLFDRTFPFVKWKNSFYDAVCLWNTRSRMHLIWKFQVPIESHISLNFRYSKFVDYGFVKSNCITKNESNQISNYL